jgi:hypothetical protein
MTRSKAAYRAVVLPAGTSPKNKSPIFLSMFDVHGNAIDPSAIAEAGPQGPVGPAGFLLSASAAPSEITGVTAAQTILTTPEFTPVAGSQWDVDFWARLTTTSTSGQSLTFNIYFGTTLLVTATYNPQAAVSDFFTRFKVRLVWTTSTHVSAVFDADGDHYPLSAIGSETENVPTSQKSIVVKIKPSSKAMSVDFGAVTANQIS